MTIGSIAVPRRPARDLSAPLRESTQRNPDAIAVVAADLTLSYAELAQRVGALGAALDALDVPLGGRIGFLGVNSAAHLECWLAVPAHGRVLVDLNFRLAENELAYMVDDCALEVLIVDDAQLATARALQERCASLRMLVLDGSGEVPADAVDYDELVALDPVGARPVDERALAAISYTGGTTGTPKGVMLSHANLLSNARHNLSATGHTAEDRWLHVCPMFHVAGTANVFACTWVGAHQTVLPRFEAALVLDTIESERITHTVLVPTMLAMLLEQLDERPGTDLRALRHVQYAASPITAELQRRVLAALSCDVAQFYGMTEAAPTVSTLTPADHRPAPGDERGARRLRSIGRPVEGVEIEVRGSDNTPLAADEIGELCVRGPNVMLGYWNRPADTAAALQDGWYHSGDAAYRDEDGYLYLVDRLKDMIITGGENVYSIEVEAALAEHPAVVEAAVFGIPDQRWGEAVHAVVTLASGSEVTTDELIAHCRTLVAGYKVPRSIECSDRPLPKSGAGKVLKNVLRDPWWAGRERQVN